MTYSFIYIPQKSALLVLRSLGEVGICVLKNLFKKSVLICVNQCPSVKSAVKFIFSLPRSVAPIRAYVG